MGGLGRALRTFPKKKVHWRCTVELPVQEHFCFGKPPTKKPCPNPATQFPKINIFHTILIYENRKITVRVTTMGGKNFKLRLPRNQFNYDLLKMKLSSAGVEHLHLYLKGRMNDKDKVPVQNEEAFQRVLEQAFKAKRPLELVMDRRRVGIFVL